MNTESSHCACPAGRAPHLWAQMMSYDLNRLLFVRHRKTIIVPSVFKLLLCCIPAIFEENFCTRAELVCTGWLLLFLVSISKFSYV